MARPRVPQQMALGVQRLGVRRPQACEQRRRPLDVGEHQGHRPGGELGHTCGPFHFQGIAKRGSCGKAPVVPQTSRPCGVKRGMHMNDVTIVGSGPTGLMLAGELALAGVDVEILERRTTSELVGTRARGFHSRTIEILDQRGLVDRFLGEGRTVQGLSFGSTPLKVADFPSRHPYTLALGQSGIERILLGWVEELGVPVRRGVEVTGFAQDDAGVDVQLADGRAGPYGVPGRGRWRAQCHPQGGRHRLRRGRGHPQLPDRRGRRSPRRPPPACGSTTSASTR